MTIIDSITEDTPSIESGGTGTFMLSPEQIAGITNGNGNGHSKWTKPDYVPTDASGRAALKGDVATLAHIAAELGIAVCPPKQDGTKAPDATDWREATREDFTVEAIDGWYAEKHYTGFGIFTGRKLSNGLVMTELEGRAVGEGAMDVLLATAIATGNEDVFIKATTGYMSGTPSTGLHFLCYCPQLEAPCQKFASCQKWHIQKREWVTKGLAESKGLGGFTIEVGTHGTVHKSGRPYVPLSGSLETIQTWSVDEYERWCDLLRTLDRMPEGEVEMVRESRTDDTSLPGNDFNARATWADVLEPHGWNRAPNSKGRENWYKPNNWKGAPHASVNHTDLLYVWSTACDLEGNRSYSKFAAYTFLNHGDDFSAATKDLAAQGYGRQSTAPLTDLRRHSSFVERAGTSSANQITPDANVPMGTGSSKWLAPEPLDNFERPVFPTEALPNVLADFTRGVSTETGTYEDMAGMLSLNAVSLVLARKVEIRGNNDRWIEPVNLYTIVIADSGEMKTPVFSQVYDPITEIERLNTAATAEERAAANASRKAAITFAKQRVKEAEKGDHVEALAEAELALMHAEGIPLALPYRLRASDITSEAIPKLLSAYGGRIGIISDEGGIFDTLAGKYNKGTVHIDVVLQGHDGGEIRVDRVGRDSEFIRRPAITFGLATQKSVVEKVVRNEDVVERGFLNRFLFSVPDSKVGDREINPECMAPEVSLAYMALLQDLDRIPRYEENATVVLRLSDAAKGLFDVFRGAIEKRLALSGDLSSSSMRGWSSKHPGEILRLAALIHFAEGGGNAEKLVSADVMERAIMFSPYLIGHARIALHALGMDRNADVARRILAWIKNNNLTSFFQRDACRQTKLPVTEIAPSLDLLEGHGYIRLKASEVGAKGGRPAIEYEVNPGC